MLAYALLLQVAIAQPETPRYHWESYSWTQTLVKKGEDRKILFGARVMGVAETGISKINIFGRADVSALTDSVDITNPSSFESAEGYIGLNRWIGRNFYVAGHFGAAFDIYDGKLVVHEKYPKSAAGGICFLLPSGGYIYSGLGIHQSSGEGLRSINTVMVQLKDKSYFVGDVVFPGNTFARLGLAIRIK